MRSGQTVHLHIGAMKTGTSFLQRLLAANEAALAGDAARFAGRTWVDQVDGVRDVLGMGGGGTAPAKLEGAWRRLLDDMGDRDLRSVISMEFLSFTGSRRATRVIESLAPADVHVVLSVRSAGMVLPGQWQEMTQNRGVVSWDRWCHDLAGNLVGTESRRRSLQAVRIPRMVNTWAPLVRPERFHVVTVPPAPAPPDVLWRRFARSLSLDADAYTLPDQQANASLGHVCAELLRRVNERVAHLSDVRYHHVVKAVLAKQVLASREGDQRIRLPRQLRRLASTWDARTVAVLRRTPCDLVGDLNDLTVDVPVDEEPPVVTDDQLLAAARHAIEGLGVRLSEPCRSRARRDGPRDLDGALEQLVELVSEPRQRPGPAA